MTDGAFETRLAGALAGLRPAEGAPASLRARVDAIPELPSRPFLRRLVGGSVGMWGAAAVSGGLAIWLLSNALNGAAIRIPGAGGIAPNPTIDPGAVGPGMRSFVIPTLLLVPGLIALASLVMAFRGVRARTAGPWHPLLVFGWFAVFVISLWFATQPGFTWRDGFFGGVLGYAPSAEVPEDGGRDTLYEVAEPGGPLIFGMTITNPGPLPVTLEGLVESTGTLTSSGTHWVQLAVDQEPDDALPEDVDHLHYFTPYTVAPGAQVDIYLVAREGDCAYGPGWTTRDRGAVVEQFESRADDSIRLAYSILGLLNEASIEPPVQLVMPVRPGCT